MHKIASLNKISSRGMNLFTSKYEFTQEVMEANGVLVRSQEMNGMEFPKELFAIARAGAGTNNIPVEECSKKGIVVFNTPGANANAVKELVLAGLFLSSRDIVSGVNWAKSIPLDVEKTVEKGKAKFSGNEIWGKTLGVIGLGAIGILVSNASADLHMKVLGYDPYLSVNAALDLSNKITLRDNLAEMLSECDYVAIHVPYSDSTKELINESLLSIMKPGIRILNFSRDKIVDEEALVKALETGKVFRYVTDFPNERIKDLDNVICIPHLGASTSESEENCAIMAVEELMDYLENGNIYNSVNFPNCSMGICNTAGRVGVLHKNIPKMIGQITNLMAEMNINISDMTNRSKGEYQYTLIDVDSHMTSQDLETLKRVSGIISVRIIK